MTDSSDAVPGHPQEFSHALQHRERQEAHTGAVAGAELGRDVRQLGQERRELRRVQALHLGPQRLQGRLPA